MKQLGNEEFKYIEPRQGALVHDGPRYIGFTKDSELPDHALDEHDFHKRLRFEELKKTKLEEMCNWKQKDIKGIKKNSYIKEI